MKNSTSAKPKIPLLPSIPESNQDDDDGLPLPYKVARSQELGRFLVAAKDLCKGEIILQELPLAAAPQKGSSLICPGCYKQPTVHCHDCGWPICSINCPDSTRHAGECSILAKQVSPARQAREDSEVGCWKPLQDTLMLLRCLQIKIEDKEKWEALLKMETNWDQWSRSQLYRDSMQLVKNLRNEFKISNKDADTDELLHVQAVLDTNAYEVKMPDMNIQGIYKLASLAEHRCLPNALKTVSSETLLLTLRAATDIPKGAHISTSYCDILWPTYQRQKYLQWSKFFSCQCERCLDPTELGSNVSSFLCPICPLGTILRPDFSSENRQNFTKDYTCEHCSLRFLAENCKSFISTAESQLVELDKECSSEYTSRFEEWLNQWTVSPAARSQNAMPKVITEDKVSKHKENKGLNHPQKVGLLHPHHALCLDACHTVFLLYSTESSTIDDLRRKESLGIHLLQATNSLFTGISMFRGTVMYELSMTKAALFARYLDQDEYESLDKRNLAEEILWLLSDALDILQYESEDQPEGQLFTLGLKQMEEFKSFLTEIVPDLHLPSSDITSRLSAHIDVEIQQELIT